MNPLRATVVIPTRNRRALLMRTLDSLEQQEAPADEYDVLVVLDGTEDDSEAWLQRRRPEHALRWVSQRQGGLATRAIPATGMPRMTSFSFTTTTCLRIGPWF